MTTTSNPKELEGAKKPARCHVPTTSLAALHAGHNNGALKYGHFNWRKEGVDALTYLSAVERHVEAFKTALENDRYSTHRLPVAWNSTPEERVEAGHDEVDPVTGVQVPHLGAAMACLSILHDASTRGMLIDNYSKPEVLEKVGGKLSNTASDRAETFAPLPEDPTEGPSLFPGERIESLDPAPEQPLEGRGQVTDQETGERHVWDGKEWVAAPAEEARIEVTVCATVVNGALTYRLSGTVAGEAYVKHRGDPAEIMHKIGRRFTHFVFQRASAEAYPKHYAALVDAALACGWTGVGADAAGYVWKAP